MKKWRAFIPSIAQFCFGMLAKFRMAGIVVVFNFPGMWVWWFETCAQCSEGRRALRKAEALLQGTLTQVVASTFLWHRLATERQTIKI